MSASVTVLVKIAVMPSASSSTYFPRSSSLPAMALTHLLQCTNGGHYRAARQAGARRRKVAQSRLTCHLPHGAVQWSKIEASMVLDFRDPWLAAFYNENRHD